jgi:DNA primase large subunit
MQGSKAKRSKQDEAAALNPVPLYRNVPGEVSLEDFEQLASERINVLLQMEQEHNRGAGPGEAAERLKKLLAQNKHLTLKASAHENQDLLSHWLVRLAFSASEELRRRFVRFEKELFEYRLDGASSQERQEFLAREGNEYKALSPEELDAMGLTRELKTVREGLFHTKAGTAIQYYGVDFTKVYRLVKGRRVLLRQGLAYVPDDELVQALSAKFEDELNENLEITSRTLPFVMRDERVEALLKQIQKVQLGDAHADRLSGTVTKDQLPMLAKRSFPMCARNLEGALSRVHHLKHFSRLQYTLFLKGIGLSMEDCLAYLKQEFMKQPLSADDFTKQYAYGVRHAYGKEGKRTNYVSAAAAAAGHCLN